MTDSMVPSSVVLFLSNAHYSSLLVKSVLVSGWLLTEFYVIQKPCFVVSKIVTLPHLTLVFSYHCCPGTYRFWVYFACQLIVFVLNSDRGNFSHCQSFPSLLCPRTWLAENILGLFSILKLGVHSLVLRLGWLWWAKCQTGASRLSRCLLVRWEVDRLWEFLKYETWKALCICYSLYYTGFHNDNKVWLCCI